MEPFNNKTTKSNDSNKHDDNDDSRNEKATFQTSGSPSSKVTAAGTTSITSNGTVTASAPIDISVPPTLPPSRMLDLDNNDNDSSFRYISPAPAATAVVLDTNSSNGNTVDVDGIPMATATAIGSVHQGLGNSQLSFKQQLNRGMLSPEVISKLRTEQGFPLGLAEELANTCIKYPLRFWIVDNSGSMRASDGTHLRVVSSINQQQQYAVVPCTRWIELQSAVEYHISLAALLDTTTYFRMLNDPGPSIGMQEFVIGEQKNGSSATTSLEDDVNVALTIIRKSSPSGVTPLLQHIQEIHRRIQQIEHQLRNSGQQAVVVIATDGLPSDEYGQTNGLVKHELTTALSDLQKLPVWIVIRLCTDEQSVVEYYNNLDSVLELQLEVLDDFFGEAKEIYTANRWLTYGLPLHRCREMGYQHRIFDLLDERLLNKDELYEFCTLLFGAAAFRQAPNLHVNWKGFVRVLENIVKSEGKTYSPRTRRMEYWINIKQLNNCYGGGWFGLKKR